MKQTALTLVLAVVVMLPSGSAMASGVVLPIDQYYERQTLKGFGNLTDRAYHERHRPLFPHNGFPNQFTGYHAAADVEYYGPSDLAPDVPVRAITDGTVAYVGTVAGYGGLVVIRHAQPEAVTSLYGHLRLRDLPVRVGSQVAAGQTIGYLGAHFSAETSGARKHLHFGIRKGSAVGIDGYEPTLALVQARWHDPNAWLARYLPQPSPSPSLVPSPSLAPTLSSTPAPAPAEPSRQSWFGRLVGWIVDWFR